jgi:hypothetical protein
VGLVEYECPVCSARAIQIKVFETRPTMPGDETIPILLGLNVYTSPRGRFSWGSPASVPALFTPDYYSKQSGILWALLAPTTTWQELLTRRYHQVELWPWWTCERKSGVILSQEDDTRRVVWVTGDILELPEPIRVERTHRRCLQEALWAGALADKVGCTEVQVLPDSAVRWRQQGEPWRVANVGDEACIPGLGSYWSEVQTILRSHNLRIVCPERVHDEETGGCMLAPSQMDGYCRLCPHDNRARLERLEDEP